MAVARERPPGKLRFAMAQIEGGRVTITLREGRVELGHTTGEAIRVRYETPPRRRVRWPAALRRDAPAVQSSNGAGGLQLRAGRARLRVDVPSGACVEVDVRRGQITSWGADGDLALNVADGKVTCRELRAGTAAVTAPDVNVHFAVAPQRLTVAAAQAVVVVPQAPYALDVPIGAEVTVPIDPQAARSIAVKGDDVRVLAAMNPLELTPDAGNGS